MSKADYAIISASVMGAVTPGARPSRTPRSPRRYLRAAALFRRLRPLHQRLEMSSTSGVPLTLAEALKGNGSASNYAGGWRKDSEASDPMDEACDVVELGWVLRRAIGFLNYMEVVDTPEKFGTTIKAGGVLDVVERYPKTGDSVSHSRRDKRRGSHSGAVVQTEEGPSIQVQWGEPYSGWCSDTFTLSEDGTRMTVSTLMKMSTGREVTYKTVYHRASESS